VVTTGTATQLRAIVRILDHYRDADATRRFFRRALATLKVVAAEVVTDAAPVYPRVLDELIPSARHLVERWANNRIEADHGRLNTGYNRCAGCAPTAPRP